MSTPPRWKARTQILARGPVASQEAIKLLSGDGGGFFNANAAHPFENPTGADRHVGDAADLPDRRGADQHVRPHGRRSAAQGWVLLRGHGDPVPGRIDPDLRQRGRAERRVRRSTASISRRDRCKAAAIWRAKKCASVLPSPPSLPTVSTASSDGAVDSMHDSFAPAVRTGPAVQHDAG